jgi:hypothetical protein
LVHGLPPQSPTGAERHVFGVREEKESFSDLIQISYPTVALKYYPEKLFKNHIAPSSWEIQHRVESFILRNED